MGLREETTTIVNLVPTWVIFANVGSFQELNVFMRRKLEGEKCEICGGFMFEGLMFAMNTHTMSNVGGRQFIQMLKASNGDALNI